jgi:hypothetical protein
MLRPCLSDEQRREWRNAGSAGIGEVRHRQRQIEVHAEHAHGRVKVKRRRGPDSRAPGQLGTRFVGEGLSSRVLDAAPGQMPMVVRRETMASEITVRGLCAVPSGWLLVRLSVCLDVRESSVGLCRLGNGGTPAV